MWPAGIALTSWSYMWRTTPIHRRNREGPIEDHLPPPLPCGVSLQDVQRPPDGEGPLLHRRYGATLLGAELDPRELFDQIKRDPNGVAPGSLARFEKTAGSNGAMAVGDEFVVRMPGPWDGPVRTVAIGEASFRFATLGGHLEAGQIEWRAEGSRDRMTFEVESWARTGDRLSALMHDTLRMAREVQVHMWCSVIERAATLAGARLERGIWVHTWRVAPDDVEQWVGEISDRGRPGVRAARQG